jgi:hypothetical protein
LKSLRRLRNRVLMALKRIHFALVLHKRFSKTNDREPVGIYQKWFVIRSIAAQWVGEST